MFVEQPLASPGSAKKLPRLRFLNLYHQMWKSFLPSGKAGGYLKPAGDQSLLMSMAPNIRDILHYCSLYRLAASKKANSFSCHLLNDSWWNTIVNEDCYVYILRKEMILSCPEPPIVWTTKDRQKANKQLNLVWIYKGLEDLPSFRPSSSEH